MTTSMISDTDRSATIPRLVRARSVEYAQSEAVVDGSIRKTYADLYADVLDFSRSLIASEIDPGDRVGLWAPNSYRWVVAALGTVSVGAVLVPINTRYKGEETRYLLAKTSARVLITEDGFLGTEYITAIADNDAGPADTLSKELPELRLVINLADDPTTRDGAVTRYDQFLGRRDEVSEGAAEHVADAVEPGHLSDLIFTSGTTGKPKGAMLCHGQTLREYEAWSEPTGLRAGDRYLVVNPFFHTFGYKAGILACLLRGATIIPQRTLDVDRALQVIETERVSVLTGPPTLYTTILDHPERARYDLSSLRVAVTGAAVVPVSLLERMRKEMSFSTILTAYGLTEAGGTVSICRPDDSNETVSHTSGTAIPDTEIRIVDDQSHTLPPGEAGEILVRGYGVMKGYFEDPAATSETIDADGWLHTGDIGVLDERGYLRITDRLKDMYIVGGFNVYPAEIEQVLLGHEAIAQAAVIGVPDERMGEVGRAFVVLRPGSELGAGRRHRLLQGTARQLQGAALGSASATTCPATRAARCSRTSSGKARWTTMPEGWSLEGQVALVTGGTKGIGRTIAEKFLAAGTEVVVCGRNEPESLPEANGRRARFVAADVRDPEAAERLVQQTADTLGRLDLLINNAGGSPSADAATVSPRFVSSIVGLNLLAPFYVAQQANAVMQTQPTGGHLINIGSISGHQPAPGTAAYTAAKAGLIGLTRALAIEWAPKVRVNMVTAGSVRTELAHLYYGDEAGIAAVAATIPMGRLAEPSDVADACLLLTSPLAAYVTGAELLVDGGGEIPARTQAANVTPPVSTASPSSSTGLAVCIFSLIMLTTVGSMSVVTSPSVRFSATSRSRRRMILPLRVFGQLRGEHDLAGLGDRADRGGHGVAKLVDELRPLSSDNTASPFTVTKATIA